MGFLSDLFGGSKASASGASDGEWLAMERTATWRTLGAFGADNVLEMSGGSCTRFGNVVWCIARCSDKKQTLYSYFGCAIPDKQDNDVIIVVDRAESFSGAQMRGDRWYPERLLGTRQAESVGKLITGARNFATFNNYQAPSPLIVHALRRKEV